MLKNKGRKIIISTAVFLFALFTFFSFSAKAATYTVVPGDSLFAIGRLFNTTSDTIIKDNKLAGSTIFPGQKLYVSSEVYTVKSGDTLSAIAKRYGIALTSLRKANNEWDDIIYVGQRLAIPGIAPGSTSQVSPVIPYTSSDLDLLARLIDAEAEGEPYNAKVAVGAVVVNRVQDPQFPNTIREVIYQRINGYYQFTPVKNGLINQPASDDAKRAAYDALYGIDPTNGALFYFDDSATNQWLWSKTIAVRIDRMVFAY